MACTKSNTQNNTKTHRTPRHNRHYATYLMVAKLPFVPISYCTTYLHISCLSFHRFDGRVVAKLPFVPISFIQGLSHRNLAGEDYTDCSFIFLYILCTMSIRQVCSSTSSVPCPSDRYVPLHPLYHVHQTGMMVFVVTQC